MLYKNGVKSSIAEIMGWNPVNDKAKIEAYRVKKIYTVLTKDVSRYNRENKLGEDIKLVQVPTSKWIPCVYDMEINKEIVEIRYVEQARQVRGGAPGELNFTPSHIEIDSSGVLQVDKKNIELNFFLMNHANNASNKLYEKPGTKPFGLDFVFMEFTPLLTAKEKLKKMDLFDLVKIKIRGDHQLPDEVLRSTAKQIQSSKVENSFYDIDNQPIEEIQYELLRMAEYDPEKMHSYLISWSNDIDIVVSKAIEKQLIDFDQSTANWMQGKKRIVPVPAGEDPQKYLVNHMLEKDPALYKTLSTKLGMKVEEYA